MPSRVSSPTTSPRMSGNARKASRMPAS
jgi:hypothetical protein